MKPHKIRAALVVGAESVCVAGGKLHASFRFYCIFVFCFCWCRSFL